MKKQLAITDINKKHRVTEKLFVTDEAQKQRKIKKLFRTVNGIFRLIYSSGVIWEKYNCNLEIHTESLYVETTDGVGNITTDSLKWDDFVYGDYSFWEHGGFEGEGSRYQVGSSDGTISDWVIGKYIVYETEVYKITSLDSENGDVTCEIVAACVEEVIEETIYSKGSISYGMIEVDEGMLPERGTLVEGSYADGYCVLEIRGTYFYYVLQND
jgi:hypothetical protein